MAATVLEELIARKAKVLTVRGDSSYATGGYAMSGSFLDKAQAGVGPSGGPIAAGLVIPGATIIGDWDETNKKVKFITRATGAEVAAASDQSAVTVKMMVWA